MRVPSREAISVDSRTRSAHRAWDRRRNNRVVQRVTADLRAGTEPNARPYTPCR